MISGISIKGNTGFQIQGPTFKKLSIFIDFTERKYKRVPQNSTMQEMWQGGGGKIPNYKFQCPKQED
jgi:hypothetical protein